MQWWDAIFREIAHYILHFHRLIFCSPVKIDPKKLELSITQTREVFPKGLVNTFQKWNIQQTKKKKISTSSLVHKGWLVFVTTVGIYTNRRRHMTVACHFDRNQFRLFTEKILAFFCRRRTFVPILIRIANSCNAVS